MLIAPPDFRTHLPARVDESGRIFLDIKGLEELYDTKGSGAAPEMLRGEMGTIWVHDLQASLGTQVAEVDAITVTAAPAAADTTAATTFSFPTLPSGGPAAAHRILSAQITVGGAAANYAGARLQAQPFGDPTLVFLALADAADVVTIAGFQTASPWLGVPQFPLWGKRATDYTFSVRSNAGGAATATLSLLVAMVPPGVALPR